MIDYKRGIVLDAPTALDKEQFFQWRNHPKIWYWCRQNGPLNWAKHNAYWFDTDVASDRVFFSVKSVEGYVGAAPSKYELVGCAGLTSIDHVNARAEFSLYIGPEHHGKGLGKKALETLFDYGFGFLNLNCIWGETFAGNPALGLFKELGMTKEGTRRDFYYRDGKYIDCHLLSILRSEWKFSSSLQHQRP